MNCNRKTLRIGLMAKNITVTIMHFVLAYSYLFWTYCLFLFANTFRSGAGLAQATKKIFSSAGENERRIKYELNNGNEDHKRNSNAEAAKGTAKRVEKTNECKSKSDERERKQKNREIKRNSPQQSVRWMCALFSIWNDDDDEDDDEYDGVALRFFCCFAHVYLQLVQKERTEEEVERRKNHQQCQRHWLHKRQKLHPAAAATRHEKSLQNISVIWSPLPLLFSVSSRADCK